MKQLLPVVFIAFLCSCTGKPGKPPVAAKTAAASNVMRLYSTHVKDSFSVFISLPDGYDTAHAKYPVVYLLDANLYFDMIVPIMHKYAEVGMVPPAILIGVGYRDFQQMDSLRNRDYTYPQAIPEYEMTVSGGADKFGAFLEQELLPRIDADYRTDTAHRVLMGHSLGGYCTLYTLFRSLQQGSTPFKYYVAASPSLDYNHGYLLKEWQKPGGRQAHSNVFITFGGLEDEEDENDTAKAPKVAAMLSDLRHSLERDSIPCKSAMYSDLGHMDAALPAFYKGLQWSLAGQQ